MSKATDDFKNFMESDRGERAIYEKAYNIIVGQTEAEPNVFMPLTRTGFEAMVEFACKLINVEVTGPIRNISVGFLHSIDRKLGTTTLTELSHSILSTLSNHMSHTIDQEIKAEANKELAEEQRKLREAQEELARQAAIDKRQKKFAKKAGKTVGEQANGADA